MRPNGDMLRLARHRRGFPQTEAAKLLDMDQSMLSRIENGLVEVRDDVLMRAAKAYDFPIPFFYQTDPVYGAPVSVHPMWRRKTDVTAREMEAVVGELNIRVMHLRRLFDSADVAHSNNLPKMDIDDYGDPEKIAGLVRAHWKIPAGPVRNLTLYVEKAGVIVAHSSLAMASISGVTFAVPGMPPLIVLNSDQPADRMRFTLGHELAHLIMHRFPSPKMEEEAHAFAVALLLPAQDIKPYFVGRRVDLPMLASLKPEWRVSMAALLMRAKKLGYISDNQNQYLWKQMSGRGYRLREPPELDFERETPTVLDGLLRVHTEGLGYSVAELAKLFRIPEREFLALYPSPTKGTSKPRPKLTVLK